MICAEAQSETKGNPTMLRRSLTLVGLALVALLALAPAASAQYVDDGSLVADPSNPDVGDSIVVTGTACGEEGITVTVSITQGGQTVVLGTAVTGPDGSYTLNASIPNNFVNGPATISDSCGGVYNINIGAVGAVGAAALPRTGSDTGTLWRVAIALVAAGGILVLSTRKRHTEATVDA